MRRLLHQIRQKLGGHRPNKHSWSAHPLLIRRRPGHFNSQLKFAGWLADVTKIHSSVGPLPAACRSPHGGEWATVRKFCSAGQTDTARSPPGRRDGHLWVTAGSSADSHSPSGDCYVIAGPSKDDHAIIHWSSTVSPWAVPYMCNVLCCYIDYIE